MHLELKNAPLDNRSVSGTFLERGATIPLERKSVGDYRNARGDVFMVTPEDKKFLLDLQKAHNAAVARQDRTIDELNRRLDEAVLEAKRPSLGGMDEPKMGKLPKGWEDYIRKGYTHALEEKALAVGSDPDGGYLAPPELADRITAVARDRSDIRSIALAKT